MQSDKSGAFPVTMVGCNIQTKDKTPSLTYNSKINAVKMS